MKEKKILILFSICMVIIIFVIIFISLHDGHLDFSYEFGENPNKINETIHYYSSDEYQIEVNKIKNRTNRNFMFPDKIADTVVCDGFSYLEDVVIIDWGKDCRAEVFFSMKYSEEEYKVEVDRISSLTNTGKNKKPVLSNDLFCLPSYIAVYNDYSRYEYVLLNSEDNEIIYLFI